MSRKINHFSNEFARQAGIEKKAFVDENGLQGPDAKGRGLYHFFERDSAAVSKDGDALILHLEVL